MAWKFGEYFRAALLNRWNLLAVAGGAALASVSGHAQWALTALLAAEAAYLGFATGHPRFRALVDRESSPAPRNLGRRKRSSRDLAARLLNSLPTESQDRFKRLRTWLLDLREIAEDLERYDGQRKGRVGLEENQLEALDRLLWVFLRLQFTQSSLSKFLDRTDEERIVQDIARLEQRLELHDQADISHPSEVEHLQKIRDTLVDHLEISRSRLDNYRKAEANHEYIDLELDRLENKIKTLAEMAVNRQEPSLITSRVDEVAESVLETEVTLGELDFITHLGPAEDHAPELLRQTIYITD